MNFVVIGQLQDATYEQKLKNLIAELRRRELIHLVVRELINIISCDMPLPWVHGIMGEVVAMSYAKE